MVNKEFDSVQFPGLTELLEESTYFNIFQDPQDRALLRALLHNCINEKVLTTNRYKFSTSADFFVPNKTLYRDYVEFVKVIITYKFLYEITFIPRYTTQLYILFSI
jgi:hypothetical protein